LGRTRELMNHFEWADKNEKYNHQVPFRLTKTCRQELKDIWKTRKYPHPKDPSKLVFFESEQQYIEFVIRCMNRASPTVWYLVSNLLNPNYPEL